MAKGKGISKADLQLWAEYSQSLLLLPGKQRLAVEPEPPPVTQARPDPPPPKPQPRAHAGPVRIDLPPPGLDRASWQKFRNGLARPARTLDLHGFTAARAHQAVERFVLEAYAAQLRVVEIITGKGEILHREVPHWLNAPPLRPLILALAHPHAANTGSVRVLLRRSRG